MYTKLSFDEPLGAGLTRVLEQQFKIGEGGKLIPRHPVGTRKTPWVFINHDTRKKFCGHWNAIYCMQFKLIPTYCRFSCWKTVIKPRNVKELFKCYRIMKCMDLPSKIGMDVRPYTFGAWAGFIYGDTLEEGRKYYKMAKKEIPKDIPIILKRGCTEMERMKPSDTWDILDKRELELEEKLNNIFSFSEEHFFQAEWLKSEVKERWIRRAIEIGDSTAKVTAKKESGDPEIWDKLVVNSITYHDARRKNKN